MVGNNGLAHVHMELHVGGRSSDIVPFSFANGGLPLDGLDLPFTGLSNEHAMDGPILSTNALAGPPPATAAPAPPSSGSATSKSGSTTPAAARCAPGQTPVFSLGFAGLKTQLGDVLGDPTTCEFADPNGSGDMLQQTTNGLAFWRKSSNTPTFTNGSLHWALTPAGWVQWTGASIDPPTAAAPASNL